MTKVPLIDQMDKFTLEKSKKRERGCQKNLGARAPWICLCLRMLRVAFVNASFLHIQEE